MSIYFFKKINQSNFFYIFFLGLFSFYVNYFYSNLGVFPIDTFLHYDSGYKILNNDYPIKDYWVVSGVVVDFFQAFFFYIFGVNWNSYVIHSSLINFTTSILTFYFFKTLNLSQPVSLFFSICFSVLAYTISGTPFVDLHATHFCLIATYLTIYSINNFKKNYLWTVTIVFYFLAFFSKQVPTAYLSILNSLILGLYFFTTKKLDSFKTIIVNLIFFSLVVILTLQYLNIDFTEFYIQFIEYPREFGSLRVNATNFSFLKFFSNFKFLLIPFVLLLFLKIRTFKIKDKNVFLIKNLNFFIYSSMFISFLIHQILTKNQIFIYFLIPLTFGYLYSEINLYTFPKKKLLRSLILIFTLFITIKYHIRYNEGRKFHELFNTNISNSISFESLNISLNKLKWINPFFVEEPLEELQLLKKVIINLEQKKDNIVLITHYLFLDSITKKKLNSLNRTYTLDGASSPIKGSKYFEKYKSYIFKNLARKNIKEILFIKEEKIDQRILTNILDKNCYSLIEDEIFFIYKLEFSCINSSSKNI